MLEKLLETLLEMLLETHAVGGLPLETHATATYCWRHMLLAKTPHAHAFASALTPHLHLRRCTYALHHELLLCVRRFGLHRDYFLVNVH